ncbi:hypothetical protein [Bdellovibrio sp. NC01]|uniref:hypothetical protein n=1 Tax=Bdellovibrio sp. NC01 TaxID=2220073 RepID=UPI001159684A|nr:hypothetical protein [Bdellovibrio sp. NC01]QDK38149.1 hypothetical protein DOE51_11420 [Bdellovibrio sp. NC01]
MILTSVGSSVLLSFALTVPALAAEKIATTESAPTSTEDVHETGMQEMKNDPGPAPSSRVDKGTAEPMRQADSSDKKAPGTRTSKSNLKQKKQQGAKTGVGGGASESNSNAESNKKSE